MQPSLLRSVGIALALGACTAASTAAAPSITVSSGPPQTSAQAVATAPVAALGATSVYCGAFTKYSHGAPDSTL